MKKNILLLLSLVFFTMETYADTSVQNPIANPEAVLVDGNVRFSVLTPRMVRMEWSPEGNFNDQKSFVFVNRNLPTPSFTRKISAKTIKIRTREMEVVYKRGTGAFSKENLSIRVLDKAHATVWRPGTVQKANLKGTYRTLDRMDGTTFKKRGEPWRELQLEDGLLARDGWTFLDDSQSLLLDDSDLPWVEERKDSVSQDWYFLAYGNDYKAVLKDYTDVAGHAMLPPRFVFGYWWSRYWAYSDNEMRDVVSHFDRYNIPIDVLVVDMDWHETDSLTAGTDEWGQRKHWTGYTWEKGLFSDPDQFLAWLKSRNLKTTLNLHPASGVAPYEKPYADFAKAMDFDTSTGKNVPWQGSDKKFMTNYFDHVLRPIEKQGVDFWWLDWQQWVYDRDIPTLNNTWWLNYTFFEDMRRNRDTRPLIYHRWGGLGNHRYPIGFSGDAYITWNTLEYQPYFTNTASNVLYGYWSHDIGGHKFIEDGNYYEFEPEMYVRWVQYGALSPILRTHSNKDPSLKKELWNYRGEYYDALYNAVRLRYRLAPYIYTAARALYDTGISPCRPMYYDYPEEENAYAFSRQYMFGDEILVSPIGKPMEEGVSHQHVWLPAGNDWFEWNTGTLLHGGQEVDRDFTLEEYPIYVKAGAVIPMYDDTVNRLDAIPNKQIFAVFPGGNGECTLYEDAGNDNNYATEFVTTRVKSVRDEAKRTQRVILSAQEGHCSAVPATRSYEVRLVGAEMPVSVIVDGRTLRYSALGEEGSWRYDGNTFTVIIPVDKVSALQKHSVEVAYSTSDIVDVNDGMAKRLRVLHKDIAARKFKYAGNYIVPRTTGTCSETNLLVEYDPEHFAEHVRYFKQHIDEVTEAVAKEDLVSPFENLKK